MKILPVALQATPAEPRSHAPARSDVSSRASDPVTRAARVESVVPAAHTPTRSDAEGSRDEASGFREIRAPKDPRAARFVMAVQALRIDESEATLITTDQMQEMRDAAEAVFQIRNGIPRPSRPTDTGYQAEGATAADDTAPVAGEATERVEPTPAGFDTVDRSASQGETPDISGTDTTFEPATAETSTPAAAPGDPHPAGNSRAAASTGTDSAAA